MSPDAQAILQHLHAVEAERVLRPAEPGLQAKVDAIKHYQHMRFAQTYADQMAQPRFARATLFFLEELYGPHDFTQRDAQFARIVPALVRLFPSDIVSTVRGLAELHALSEALDTAMARALPAVPVVSASYLLAWQQVGQREQRMRQIALMLQIGRSLERYTKNPLLRHSLRLMRVPAQAAGLGTLQSFLEAGFDTFREMRGAEPFLQTVSERETRLAEELFACPSGAGAHAPDSVQSASLLGQLP